MKRLTTLIALGALCSTLLSIQAQARQGYGEESVRPGETCAYIAQKNSYNGSQCAEVLNNANYMSPAGAAGCLAVAKGNTYNGLTCMQKIADKEFQSEAVAVCKVIAEKNSYNGAQCMEAIGDKEYRYGVLESCEASAQGNSYNGLTCMQKSGQKMQGPIAGRCPSLRDIKKMVRRSVRAMEHGNYYRSEKIQNRLLNRLQGCR